MAMRHVEFEIAGTSNYYGSPTLPILRHVVLSICKTWYPSKLRPWLAGKLRSVLLEGCVLESEKASKNRGYMKVPPQYVVRV